jgi:hypothetical protein
VILGAEASVVPSSGVTHDVQVDLVVNALLSDLVYSDVPYDVFLAVDDEWTQATIVDEEFYTQEDPS